MLAEDTAAVMGDTAVGTAANMSRPVMLRADMALFVLAVGVAANLSGPRTPRALCRAWILPNSRRVRWGGYNGYPYDGYSRYSLGYYGLGYGYPNYGYYGYRSGRSTIHITDTTLGDIILTAMDTGRP